MLTIIITAYLVVGVLYWLTLGVKGLPKALSSILMVVFMPVVFVGTYVTSLPEALKKEGKHYPYRWVVYATFFFLLLSVILIAI